MTANNHIFFYNYKAYETNLLCTTTLLYNILIILLFKQATSAKRPHMNAMMTQQEMKHSDRYER